MHRSYSVPCSIVVLRKLEFQLHNCDVQIGNHYGTSVTAFSVLLLDVIIIFIYFFALKSSVKLHCFLFCILNISLTISINCHVITFCFHQFRFKYTTAFNMLLIKTPCATARVRSVRILHTGGGGSPLSIGTPWIYTSCLSLWASQLQENAAFNALREKRWCHS